MFDDIPSIRYEPPQPKPKGLLVYHHPPDKPQVTVIVREWGPDGPTRCRLCPANLCRATPQGTCMVVAPGHVDDASAAYYRHSALGRRLPWS